ncbi:hypothetical protein Tco_1089685 [Tanacetum coccineum]
MYSVMCCVIVAGICSSRSDDDDLMLVRDPFLLDRETAARQQFDKMAEENVPAPSPTRSDEQILPFNAWLLIGKGNLLLDLQKLQKNHIFRISQFWNTLAQDAKTEALEVTPVDSTYPFESPPAGE